MPIRKTAASPGFVVPASIRPSSCAIRIVQPRDVEHGSHLREATVGVADQLRLGAVERDFTGRHGAGSQLVLQPIDAIVVAAAVGSIAWHEKEREAPRSGRRALGSSQCQRDLTPDVGAEELLPEETPAISITFRDDDVLPDVRAALAFGHPLAGCPRLARITADQVPEHGTRLAGASRV